MAWKYSAIAYSLILKDVGVLLQTLYLTATDMGLGGCAIGTGNIELFARMTGQDFHHEGPVGQFALGRPQKLATIKSACQRAGCAASGHVGHCIAIRYLCRCSSM